MGLTTVLEQIRNEIALTRAQFNQTLGEMESRLRELESRMDKYDLPVDTAKSSVSKGKAMARPVPVPERPEIMKSANVGIDPR